MRAQPISAPLLDALPLSKLNFDREGLILAFRNEQPIGFIHASLPMNGAPESLGVICQLVLRPDEQNSDAAAALIAEAEKYLIARGATEITAGGFGLASPFYLGMYGGADMPGAMQEEPHIAAAYLANGYELADESVVLQRQIIDFRPKYHRQLFTLGRSSTVKMILDPPAEDWNEACTFAPFDRVRFDLRSQKNSPSIGSADFFWIEPLGNYWHARVVALRHIEIDPNQHRQMMGTHLLCESMKLLALEGVDVVETFVPSHNAPALSLFHNLGFEEIDKASVFRKTERT